MPIVALTANALVGDAEAYGRRHGRPPGQALRSSPAGTFDGALAAGRRCDNAPVAGSRSPAAPRERPRRREPLLDQAALNNIRALDDDGAVLGPR